ncbi:hypothetical protein Tco_1207548 [Tanacetum coccineum]
MFTDSTTKVDSEPPNGLNDDITNPCECDQTLNVSACTLNLSASTSINPKKERLRVWSLSSKKRKVYASVRFIFKRREIFLFTSSLINNFYKFSCSFSQQVDQRPGPQLMTPGTINSGLVQNIPSPTPIVPPTKNEWDSFFQPMFDEYFKPPPNVNHPVPEVHTLVLAASTKQQSSVIPQGFEDDFYDIEVAHMDNDPYFGIPIPEPSSEETTLQGVIPSNLHHLNYSFDILTELTKKHPLKNVIGDPS